MSNGIKFYVSGCGFLNPKKDVTALEALQLSLLVSAILADPTGDYTEYVKTNQLERHFNEEVV